MELNPNHHVTSKMHDNWHKLLAIVLHKYRDVLGKEVVITAEDIDALTKAYPKGLPVIVANDKQDGLHISLVTEIEARMRLGKAGGTGSLR